MIERVLDQNVKVWVVIGLVIFYALFRDQLPNPIPHIQNLGWWQFWVGFFTFLGPATIIVAIWQYADSKKAEKIRALQVLKSQLNVIEQWGSGGYDPAQVSSVRTQNYQTWSDPFADVFPSESTGMQSLWALPGVITLQRGSNIPNAIAELNQTLGNFNSMLETIRAYKFSYDGKFLTVLAGKINRLARGGSASFDPEEVAFRDRLADMYAELHCFMIGDINTGRLHTKRRALRSLVTEECQRIGIDPLN